MEKTNRIAKVKLLSNIFNDCDIQALNELRLSLCSNVLIFQPHGKGTMFSTMLNPTISQKYQNKVMSDCEIDTMLIERGNSVTFLLPDNQRD